MFSDLDGDGNPELVLATEWGTIRVFKQSNGQFEERTRELGLDEYQGWWNGVATGDLDGDGRLEIVASNWGLNSAYQTSRQYPRKVYFGDLDGNGTFDLIEARFSQQAGQGTAGTHFQRHAGGHALSAGARADLRSLRGHERPGDLRR